MLMRFTTATSLLPDLRPSEELAEVTLVTTQGRLIELRQADLALLNSALHGEVEVLAPESDLDIAERWLTPEDAAEALGVTRQTIYSWQKSGRLGRRHREGSRVRFVPLTDVRKIQEQRRANEEFKAWLLSKPPVTDGEADLAARRFAALSTRLHEAE